VGSGDSPLPAVIGAAIVRRAIEQTHAADRKFRANPTEREDWAETPAHTEVPVD